MKKKKILIIGADNAGKETLKAAMSKFDLVDFVTPEEMNFSQTEKQQITELNNVNPFVIKNDVIDFAECVDIVSNKTMSPKEYGKHLQKNKRKF